MTRKKINRILFVCTGNSCRSIMAEAYFLKRAKEERIPVDAASAGTLGISGMSPADNTLKVLEEEGIDHGGLESTGLDAGLIDRADLVLVMDPQHRETVLSLVPGAADKVLYLREFSGNGNGKIIPDPMGCSLDYYRGSLGIIKKSIEGLLEWIKE